MSDEPEHKRVRTVLDDVAEANTARTMERLARKAPIDTDPRIENSGKPLRIRGMIEDGKLVLPGETPTAEPTKRFAIERHADVAPLLTALLAIELEFSFKTNGISHVVSVSSRDAGAFFEAAARLNVEMREV